MFPKQYEHKEEYFTSKNLLDCLCSHMKYKALVASQVSGNIGSLPNHPNEELAPVPFLWKRGGQNILAVD